MPACVFTQWKYGDVWKHVWLKLRCTHIIAHVHIHVDMYNRKWETTSYKTCIDVHVLCGKRGGMEGREGGERGMGGGGWLQTTAEK